MEKINLSEVTSEHLYVSRRKLLVGLGALAASTVILSACRRGGITPPPPPGTDFCDSAYASKDTDELGAKLTSCQDVTHYNNYYEFSTEKEDVATLAQNFKTSPWEVKVGGLVNKPLTFSLDDLLRKFPPEERIYRLRCVEAWSMVIPWLGFPLAALLKEVEPTSKAKYVRFETIYDPNQMPGQKRGILDWPYVEGLRLDEAMHNLTILATGLFGKPLPPQDGAPIRLVVPWKYDFKSIKSIVKIDLVEEMPVSAWMAASPNEYGFYSNVNPDVPHPRWSQSSERRIGQFERIKTLLFNGYADEVAYLYAGMDLKKFF
ncbi:MAG: protein-methionine-sulfoxide reductase catalytic subunit MsrP [Chloroflexota bacterium]|nr:protein-methionine-sulfoxide reductase catalytic subunit MsrP [Chloroflexota bacterium]